ncbi:MAG TPA: hypothetical protein VMR20_00695, partial [Verrucomicrobiae bacterium]|nr:hypothetical protein [Verrucomicrobiae bacterium]
MVCTLLSICPLSSSQVGKYSTLIFSFLERTVQASLTNQRICGLASPALARIIRGAMPIEA